MHPAKEADADAEDARACGGGGEKERKKTENNISINSLHSNNCSFVCFVFLSLVASFDGHPVAKLQTQSYSVDAYFFIRTLDGWLAG